jgi:hypothetical protein
MKKICINSITEINDGEFLPRQISESVALLIESKYFIPALSLMACSIDALTAKGDKQLYIKSLQKYFPDLCAEISPVTFYEKFRNGSAHLLSPMEGFAIGRDFELSSKFIETNIIKETNQEITILNIDRFYDNFKKFVESTTRESAK